MVNEMQGIPLQAIPRQAFSITLDGVKFDISLVAVQDCMYADIVANGIAVINGIRCVSGKQIMPYNYMEGQAGNFGFSTPGGENPWWEQFETTHFMMYATAAELATVRAAYVHI